MDILVCIGSSCHLKGSYNVINAFKKLIAEHDLADQVHLSATFCIGHCQNGIATKINGKVVTGLNTDNVKDIFDQFVLKELQEK